MLPKCKYKGLFGCNFLKKLLKTIDFYLILLYTKILYEVKDYEK